MSQDIGQNIQGVQSSVLCRKFALIAECGVIQWVGIDDEAFEVNSITATVSMVHYSSFDIEEALTRAKGVLNFSYNPYGVDSAVGVAISTDLGFFSGCTGMKHCRIVMITNCVDNVLFLTSSTPVPLTSFEPSPWMIVENCSFPNSICGIR